MYVDRMKTEQKAIILLHGFPFDKTMWDAQVKLFSSSYRMLPVDIRGFGQFTDEESTFSIELFADDLLQMMDSMDIKKAILCGLSMGGFIALKAMEQFPDRFEALILCDTQCIADTKEVREKRNEAIKDIEANGADAFKKAFLKKVFHKDILEDVRRVVFANSDHVITRGLTALAERSETCSTLADITIPTLIICGREDEVTPLAQSEAMHAAIKGSVLRVIDEAGHLSNLEQPEEFNRHMMEFLETLDQA